MVIVSHGRHTLKSLRKLGKLFILAFAMLGASSSYAQNGFNSPNGFGNPGNFQQPNNGTAFRPMTPQTGPSLSSPSVGSGVPDARMAALNTGSTTASGVPASAETAEATDGKIATRNLLQMFHEGGWMMYPIALCSFVLTVFCFERLIALRGGRVIPRPFVRRLIEQLQQQQIEKEEALELCERNPSPIAQIFVAAVKKYGRPAVEVEQSVLDSGERVTYQLRRHLRLLNAISNVSPLLGLLGTVLGMIEAFNAISTQDAMGRTEMLAGGIGHAMLTTAAGLLVAIPAYLAYMYFLGRTDRLVMEMDVYAQQVIDAISAEGLSESEHGKSRSKTRRSAA